MSTFHEVNVFPKKWLSAECSRWLLPHTRLVTQAEKSHKRPVFSSSHIKATGLNRYQYTLAMTRFRCSAQYTSTGLFSWPVLDSPSSSFL